MTAGQDSATTLQQFIEAYLSSVGMHSANSPEKSTGQESEWADFYRGWLSQLLLFWQSVQANHGQVSETASTANALPPVTDPRFQGGAWSESAFHDYLRRAYLANSARITDIVNQLPVHNEKQRQQLRFMTDQYVAAWSPANFLATNPEAIATATATQGESLRVGLANLLADLKKGVISSVDPSGYEVGRNLAVTPGEVIFENDLFQLIEYAPSTDKVFQRPLLIIPPCINKYYILDLRPENSFVRYAVGLGHTVFLISWRNITQAQGRLTWDDYVEYGVLKALELVRSISGIKQVNALGFCVGGTLLMAALAVAQSRGYAPVKSLTLLTTLLDFSEAGDLGNMVDEPMLALHEQRIGEGGIFSGREFAAVFSSLRPNELVWNYVVNGYLMGKKPPAFDLLFWNSDNTNLPGPFLVWYLRNMYLENRLSQPRSLEICGSRVDLSSLKMPSYVFAARQDHIVPWKGAYRSMRCLGGQSRFVLGASGHIAGVINPPSSKRRSYWLGQGTPALAEDWLHTAKEFPGSWWEDWANWLKGFGGRQLLAESRKAHPEFSSIEHAPGRYVMEKAA